MESREVLRLEIELPDGGSDEIVVHEADEPAELALMFCQKHGLANQNQESLANLIENSIDQLIEEEKSSGEIKENLVKQALVLQPRKRPASPQLVSQARQVHDSFLRPQPRRPSSTAPTQKKAAEKDNINRYGIKTPLTAQKQPQKRYYDKLDQYFNLFELLNPNSEGKISADSLSVPSLPTNMVQVITPLINELKSSHKTIGFSDFTQAMDKIVLRLEDGNKALLLETNHKKEYNFTTNKSGKMPLYERQMLIRMKNEEKLKEKRMIKENEELRECKFQPSFRSNFRK